MAFGSHSWRSLATARAGSRAAGTCSSLRKEMVSGLARVRSAAGTESDLQIGMVTPFSLLYHLAWVSLRLEKAGDPGTRTP